MLRSPLILMTVLAAIGPSAIAAEPAKLAESARFDITADAAVEALENGHALEGGAALARMSWKPEAERSRGYTVSFPINHRGWRTAAVQFTPKRDGTDHPHADGAVGGGPAGRDLQAGGTLGRHPCGRGLAAERRVRDRRAAADRPR